MNKNKKGFTLIELLVVIAIIGLLSALSVLALGSARARARDAKRVADVKQIQTALEMYYNDMNDYPIVASLSPTSSSGIYTPNGVYMRTIPAPPTVTDGAGCPSTQAWYTYTKSNSGATATYTIQYCLGANVNDIPGNAIQTASPAGIR